MLGLFVTKAHALVDSAGNDVNRIDDFSSMVKAFIRSVLTPLGFLFVAAGVAYFLAGVLKYMRQSSDDKERDEGRKMMLYGIIALFVMISVWGLVRVLQGTFVLDNNPSSFVPTFR